MKLQTKIITAVIFITLSVNIFFQYNFIKVQKDEWLLSLSNKMLYTNDVLSKINSGPIFYYDIPLIEININSFLKDPEIKSIGVKESSGEIDLFFEDPQTTSKDTIEVGTDIYYGEDKIGRIIITYTKDVINRKLSDSISLVIKSFIAATIFITLILLLLIRKIIKPIMELTDLTSEISNGNLAKEIHIYSNDEIGVLSKSFMRMRDSIKEKIQSLYIENEERKRVEIALKLNTEELAKANTQLTNHRVHLEEIVQKRTNELQESLNNLKQTKDQLVESEKMAALGDLVAGVAHEINTPVGIGVTAASHLESESKKFLTFYYEGQLTKSHFENFMLLVEESSKIILSNMLRAATLIQSFKRVAVDQSSEEMRLFPLKEYIEEVLLSLNAKFKHTNFTIHALGDDKIEINSYPGALFQIITNLVMNSLQHGFEKLDSGDITIEVKQMENKAKIIYKDTGHGIPEFIQKKIFDPFFTTKRGQGGSGLGLHIVYNLITQTLKGNISMMSEPEKGTTFNIEIPLKI